MRLKFIMQFFPFVFIALGSNCTKDGPVIKEIPEEKISYVTSIRNELDHSPHDYFYNEEDKIRRYIGEDYWADFIYNEEGKMVKEEDWNDEGSEIIGIKEFSYNPEGLMDTVEFFRTSGGLSDKVAIIAFEYNQRKQIMQEIAYYPVTSIMEKMLYQYDENGNQTKMDYFRVYSYTTIFIQSVIYQYDTCKNAYKGIDYPFSNSLLKKTIHDYPNLSKVNNITRVDVFDRNGELNWYIVYDYQDYTEDNYPHDVIKTVYNNNGEILFERYRYFTYLKEETN